PTTVLTIRLKQDSQYAKHTIGRFRLSLTSADKPTVNDLGLPAEVIAAVKIDPAAQTASHKDDIAKYYRTIASLLAPVRTEIADLEKQREAIVKAFPVTLVSMSVAPRTIRILPRGNWL